MSSPTPPLAEALPTVGFIGLGNMGSGMTRNLQAAGFPLVVTDLRRESAAELIAGGARWAETPREVAATSDLVITMLPAPKHVAAVAAGADGLIAGLPDGGTWIDMSTSVPDVLEAVRIEQAGRGLHLLDAPGERDVGRRSDRHAADLHRGRRRRRGPSAARCSRRWVIQSASSTSRERRGIRRQAHDQPAVVLAPGRHRRGALGRVAAGVDLGCCVMRSSPVRRTARSSPATCSRSSTTATTTRASRSRWRARISACPSIWRARSGCRSSCRSLVEQIYRRARAQYGDRAGEMTPVRLYEELLGRDLRREVAA